MERYAATLDPSGSRRDRAAVRPESSLAIDSTFLGRGTLRRSGGNQVWYRVSSESWAEGLWGTAGTSRTFREAGWIERRDREGGSSKRGVR